MFALTRLRQLSSGFCRSIRGVGAVEFSLIIPVLSLLLVCSVDFGLGAYRQMQVQSAAQAGSEYAVLHGFDTNAIASAVAGSTTYSALSATPTPTQFCGCQIGTAIQSSTCGSTCSSGKTAGLYVSVYTAASYSTILNYPFLPSSFALSGQATARVR